MQNHNQYYVADLPTRQQVANHFTSSIEQPNLANVEAQLLATRQRNHQLGMEYFRNKFGTTQKYQPYASMYRAEGINQRNDFQAQLDRQAEQIKRKQLQKIRKKSHGISFEKVQEQQDINKANKRAKQNPWLQKKKNTGKIQKQDNRKQKISKELDLIYDLVDKANHKQDPDRQFVSGFKSYLLNKTKLNQSLIISDEDFKNANISNGSYTSKDNKNNKSPNKQNITKQNITKQNITKQNITKQNITKQNITKTTTHQEQLVKKIFKDLIGQAHVKSIVLKGDLIKYLTQNKRIITVLGFNQEEFRQKLLSYPTKNSQHISYKELVLFILKILGKDAERKVLEVNWRQAIIPKGCMLTEENIKTFEQVFKKMDKHKDLIVPRIPLITQLATEPSLKKLLNYPAVYEPQMEREVSLRRVFQRIELQCLLGDEEQRIAKQYISWEELMRYFESGHNDRRRYNMIILVQTLKKQQKLGLQLIPQVVCQIIARSVERLQNVKDYFQTFALIQSIEGDYEYGQEKYTMARLENCQQTGLPMETFQEIMTRIKQTAHKYTNMKEFLQYFSISGKPAEEIAVGQVKQSRNLFGKSKILQDSIVQIKQSSDINGYDSDPEMYQSNHNLRNSPKKLKNFSPKHESGTNKFNKVSFNVHQNFSPQQTKIANKDYKITVPVPFSFDEREKQREEKKKNNSSLKRSESLKHFKAKQIPKSVMEIGLYQKMMEEDRKRQQQRKKNCMLMTLANENPFSFASSSKPMKKSRQERKLFEFHAKPIPWYCSVELLNKKAQQDIIRDEKIAKKAQQKLSKAKLPPRMEKAEQQKLARQIINQQKQLNKTAGERAFAAKKPPDFQKLHRQFEEELERKRKENKTTQVKQFQFTKMPHRQNKVLKDEQKVYHKRVKSVPKSQTSVPAAPTTAKFNQLVQKRRKEKEERQKKEEQKRLEQEKRNRVDEELKKKVIQLANIKKIQQKEQQEKRREEMRIQDKNNAQMRKNTIQKGRKQPMLVERPLKRDEKIQKMKRLHAISLTLKSNGIKGKDHDSYFKKDQLLLLQDYQVLKNRI